MHKLSPKLFVAIGLLWACAVVPASAATPDAWVTTKAKMKIITDQGPSALGINVDTVNGRVTLHGKVATAEEKTQAEAAVKNIDGVQSVRNLIQVVPDAQHKAVEAKDEDIQANVSKALKDETALADSSIKVQSVNKGVVLLSGNAKTMSDHLAAVEIAAGVPGVRDVASEIESPDKLADAEVWKDTRTESAGDAPGGVRSTASDAWITSAVKMRMMTDSAVPALDVNVDTSNGVVTLFGMVPSAAAKSAAEADARKVSGVKNVVNDLQVVPESKQEAVQEKDDDIQKRLTAALNERDELDGINVEVKNGVARLTGTVDSGSDRLQAAVIARSTKGVRSVEDDMKISN
jgi:osmotically-inducible protein OsmY